MPTTGLPEFREWGVAAVRLLQGAVSADDGPVWDVLLSSQSQLEEHFARIGLLLVIDEPEGLAYLRQLSDDERPEGYDQLPKLFRRTRLGYDATVLCVLLREELFRFDAEDVHNERCVVEAAALFDQWKAFFPPHHDEVRQRREFTAAMRRLDEAGFVRPFGGEGAPPAWEVRRILKARLPAAELERLKAQLLAAAARHSNAAQDPDPPSDADE